MSFIVHSRRVLDTGVSANVCSIVLVSAGLATVWLQVPALPTLLRDAADKMDAILSGGK